MEFTLTLLWVISFQFQKVISRNLVTDVFNIFQMKSVPYLTTTQWWSSDWNSSCWIPRLGYLWDLAGKGKCCHLRVPTVFSALHLCCIFRQFPLFGGSRKYEAVFHYGSSNPPTNPLWLLWSTFSPLCTESKIESRKAGEREREQQTPPWAGSPR